MRDYELVTIMAPLTEEGATAATLERVKGFITGLGGEVAKVDEWGLRKLAYPIQRNREGYYTVLNFRMNPDSTKTLERDLKLTEQIIRYLLVRLGD